MESRILETQMMESYDEKTFLVQKKKAQRAAKKVGMSPQLFLSRKSKDYVRPSKEEKTYCRQKNLTIFQGRLRALFRLMLEQQLEEEAMKRDLNGHGRVVCHGVTFKRLMLSNDEIAESVFSEWANRIGIAHLYHDARYGQNEVSSASRNFLYCIDTPSSSLYEDDIGCQRGMVVSVVSKGLADCSGLDVYERFCQLLRMLR